MCSSQTFQIYSRGAKPTLKSPKPSFLCVIGATPANISYLKRVKSANSANIVFFSFRLQHLQRLLISYYLYDLHFLYLMFDAYKY